MGRIVYTVAAGTFLGRRYVNKQARPGTTIDGERIVAAVEHQVVIDFDDRKLERLAVRAVRNLAGRAVDGPATARARRTDR